MPSFGVNCRGERAARHARRRAGFTLIELVVTLFVAGLVFAIAVPGLKDMVRNNRLTTATNRLVSGLYLARSEAVARNQPVSLCADDGPSRWYVASGDQCDKSALLKVVDGARSGVRATGVRQIVFRGDGTAPAVDSSRPAFELVNASFRRAVYVRKTGRIRTERSREEAATGNE